MHLPRRPTDVWVLYDHDTLYVSARCWDSQPERMVANEMRRDHINLYDNETSRVILDTFYDRRNGFFFYATPLGGFSDSLVTDEWAINKNWNAVWDVKARRFDEGWSLEMAIPFKSLRYEPSVPWGINFRRRVRWKNETSFLTPIPAARGARGVSKLSSAGTVVGIQVPRRYLNLELKPYAIGGVQTNLDALPAVKDDLDGEFGGDLKVGLTRSLTLDLTYNTDFAQVEQDEQQVNLTRFDLFFPEKREFFLEGQGYFNFGTPFDAFGYAPTVQPVMFFSRRIGLSDLGPVPIRAGGRLTGKAGAFGIGALHIQTDDDPPTRSLSTDFSVLRVKRDILRRGTVGVLATRRAPSLGEAGTNRLVGADAHATFFEFLSLEGYYVGSQTGDQDDQRRDDASYQARANWAGDRYGFDVERLVVGADFNAEVGFVPRTGFERSYGQVRFSPRPRSWKAVRKIGWSAALDHITGRDGQLETQQADLNMRVDMDNGDVFNARYRDRFERLDAPFEIVEGIVIPADEYRFWEAWLSYEMGRHHKVSGLVGFTTGRFYGGDRTEASYSGSIALGPQLTIEPRVFLNWVALPGGRFTTTLLGSRVSYTFTPRMDVAALVQYNSTTRALDSNVRFRWEYTPGSDLFVVYSDGRDTLSSGFPEVRNQTFVVKFTRLFRF